MKKPQAKHGKRGLRDGGSKCKCKSNAKAKGKGKAKASDHI